MNLLNPKFLIVGGLAAIAIIIGVHSFQASATNVTIDTNLSVTPSVISFETVFPGEVHFRPLNVGLSSSFVDNIFMDDVEYRILQRIKPKTESQAERDYCQLNPTDYTRCYHSLCPYLSKEPDTTPENDTGVPAYHDPNATSSIALGRLAKSDEDLVDNWTIDLHTPCFRGECDQTNSVAPEYQLDPSLNGETFGCDLVVEVTDVSYFTIISRTPGFWQTHTAFTSNVFQTYLAGTMNVGAGSHIRTITNLTGNGQSRLFGAFYSSIPKKTNNQNRTVTDKTRMQLLQQLVAAKLNCAVFTCPTAVSGWITTADSAYASGTVAQMTASITQLDYYNNLGEPNAIPPSYGDQGAATPSQSQTRANKGFWDSP